MSEVKKFPQEQVETIMAEGEQVLDLACAFGWTRPEPGAPASIELCRTQAAALRRAVIALCTPTFKPTLEQKKAWWPHIEEDGKEAGALKICHAIAMLEAYKLTGPLQGGTWYGIDTFYGPRQDYEELFEGLLHLARGGTNMKRFDFETWFRDHCNEPRADNGHHCNPMGILVDLFVHEAKFPTFTTKSELLAYADEARPAGELRLVAEELWTRFERWRQEEELYWGLAPWPPGPRRPPWTSVGVEKSIHRAEYRAHLFTMDLEELREQLDNQIGLLRSCLPITEQADFDMAKSAALDVLDTLEAIQGRALIQLENRAAESGVPEEFP